MRVKRELTCDCHRVDAYCLGRLVGENCQNCWNHAKILPTAVVATGPDDAVLKELAALLLQLPEVGLLVADVEDDATERWTAAPIDSRKR